LLSKFSYLTKIQLWVIIVIDEYRKVGVVANCDEEILWVLYEQC